VNAVPDLDRTFNLINGITQTPATGFVTCPSAALAGSPSVPHWTRHLAARLPGLFVTAMGHIALLHLVPLNG
jgi:hypothetical protein